MQRIVGCFLEYDGKFVILRRRADKPNGNTWGLPAGKVETGETDAQAMLRELYEETGYQATPNELEHLGNFKLGTPHRAYMFTTYRIRITEQHRIAIEPRAHEAFLWVSPHECFAESDLIADFHDLLKLVGFIATQG
ncbi:MAG: NUDIX hydrolase [Candidatus Micrarchaeaceae archaeon]